jgi:hypothetical protein
MGAKQATRQDGRARQTKRHKTNTPVGLRKQGEHRVEARLLDLSRYGFRVDMHGLTPESIVWLKLPGADPQMARVVWSDHAASGCVFMDMLPAALFRQTLQQGKVEATVIAGPWVAAAG